MNRSLKYSIHTHTHMYIYTQYMLHIYYCMDGYIMLIYVHIIHIYTYIHIMLT